MRRDRVREPIRQIGLSQEKGDSFRFRILIRKVRTITASENNLQIWFIRNQRMSELSTGDRFGHDAHPLATGQFLLYALPIRRARLYHWRLRAHGSRASPVRH